MLTMSDIGLLITVASASSTRVPTDPVEGQKKQIFIQKGQVSLYLPGEMSTAPPNVLEVDILNKNLIIFFM